MRKTLACAVGCVALGLGTFVMAGDWPQYRGENTDGIVALKAPIEKLELTPVWQAPLGDAFGQIAVSGGGAALLAERGDDEALVLLNAATGKETGNFPIGKSIKDKQGGNGPRTTPAIDGTRVYAYGTYIKLICVDSGTGKQVWMHDIKKEFGGNEPQWGNASSPVLVDDLVIVGGGGAGKGILAFKKDSGQLAWAKTDERFTHATPTLATIAGTKQLIFFMQSGLVSVDPKSGEVLWKFAHKYSTSTAASPVVGGKDGNIVFCSAAYNVGAAACKVTKDGDKWTATELWRTEGKNMIHWSTPVYRDGYIYGLFGKADKRAPLACLDINTGEVKWSQANFGNQGGIILLGDNLLIQTPGGELVLASASPDGYKELGRKSILKGKNWTAPSYANGMIFARNSSEGGVTAEAVCLKLAAK